MNDLVKKVRAQHSEAVENELAKTIIFGGIGRVEIVEFSVSLGLSSTLRWKEGKAVIATVTTSFERDDNGGGRYVTTVEKPT